MRPRQEAILAALLRTRRFVTDSAAQRTSNANLTGARRLTRRSKLGLIVDKIVAGVKGMLERATTASPRRASWASRPYQCSRLVRRRSCEQDGSPVDAADRAPVAVAAPRETPAGHC
jgi:hypothetical protein